MLCPPCDAILNGKTQLVEISGILRPTFVQHKDLSSLKSALAVGCYICSFFMHKFREEEIANLWHQEPEGCATSVFFNKKEYMNYEGSFYIFMQLGAGVKIKHVSEGKWPVPPSSLFVFQPIAAAPCQPEPRYPIFNSTSSEMSWATAARWFQNCDANHTRCKQRQKNEAWYPTRLLDLGPPSTSLNYPRLIITGKEKSISSPYVTLSYRWGQSNQTYLTKSSFEALQAGIDIAQLPQTFRDAIMVTKCRLSMRYLWIDTFCIFQDKDDLSDWAREAAQMNLVYENAYCNLSATGVVDSTDGFFFNRRLYPLQDMELDLVCPRASQDARPTKYAISDAHYWDNELNQLPLQYRGWVVQERLLAPRVLHFCPNQLVWECAEMDAAEAYPEGLPAILANVGKTRFKSLDPLIDGKRLRYQAARDSDTRFFTHALWFNIVGTYTRCALTHQGDKLVALSGIAKRMRTVMRDEYVVGMWRQYLANELLWYVNGHWELDSLTFDRRVDYRAPSFSWAAADGSISLATLSDASILCSIRDIRIEYATEDTTGLVKGGYLILECTLKRLQLHNASKPGTYQMNINGRDMIQNSDKESSAMRRQVLLDFRKSDFAAENEAGELFLVPIQRRHDTNRPWPPPSLKGLVLQHRSDGEFYRIGIWSTEVAEEMDFIQAHHENEGSLPCIAYDSENRTHTIRII